MSYMSRANESKYTFMDNGDIRIEGAVIIWSNFAGNPTKFNPQGGKRTFNLVLNEELADILSDLHWNIKRRPPREEGDDPLIFTEVVLNMESKVPPEVYLVTQELSGKKRTPLTASTVGILDRIQVVNFDLVLHPHVHDNGVKGYCNVLYAVQNDVTSYFANKYNFATE